MVTFTSVSQKLLVKYQNILVPIGSVLILLLLGFWWLYHLGELPGLHGDEAWVGLKAIEFKNDGINQITGMNNYTGILQALIAEIFFDLFGKGVFQLRLGGVILNFIGLIILSFTIVIKSSSRRSLVFLMIIAQSALFVFSPRVAWEVNAFTLFLFSVAFASFLRIKEQASAVNFFWVFLFLFSNLLGSYNHILFSCTSISIFIGTILWEAKYKLNQYRHLVVVLAISNFMVVLVFLFMRYYIDLVPHTKMYLILIILGALVIGTMGYFWLLHKVQIYKIPISINRVLVRAILLLSILAFIVFHGIAFFQVASSYKIILQMFAYESSMLIETILFISGAGILITFLIQLIKDIKLKNIPVCTFWIVLYMGIFCIYTLSCSFRYYLSLYILMAVYMSYRISGIFVKRLFLIATITGFLIIHGLVYDIFIVGHIPLKASDFRIGNRQKETTAHFLPKEPILDFLKKNKTGGIQYLLDDPYFVQEPILFYKAINPWIEVKNSKAYIDYDYTQYNNGFLLYKQED